MTDAVFGPLIGQVDVEEAVLSVVQTWLDTYLSAVERAHELPVRSLPRPPADDSYFGSIDFETYEQDQCPSIIVVVNPAQGELLASAGYGHYYAVQVGAVIIDDDEDTTRALASHYSVAIAGAVIQRGGLGGFASRTTMTEAPHVVFPNPDQRRIANGICTFSVFVEPILDEKLGPALPDGPFVPNDPPSDPVDPPQVEQVEVTVLATPLG